MQLVVSWSAADPDAPAPACDPYWSFVSLLVPGDEVDINNNVVCSGSAGLTNMGDSGGATISTSTKKFGTASMAFDGTGDFFTAGASYAGFIAESSDFTLEAWINPTVNNAQKTIAAIRPASGTSGGWVFYTSATGKVGFVGWNTVEAINIVGTTTVSTGAWTHVAVTKAGTTWRLFVNGALDASGTETGVTTVGTSALYIGKDASNAARDFQGYIDDFRITKGAARYTASFAPPSEAFTATACSISYVPPEPAAANVFALIHANGTHGTYTGTQTNSGASGKEISFMPGIASFSVTTSDSKWGGVALSQTNKQGGLSFSKYSPYFAGNTTPYSVEAWIKLNALGVTHVIFSTGVGSAANSGSGRQAFEVNSNNCLRLIRESRVYADPSILVVANTALTSGVWHHVACSYDGTTTRLFLNGQLDGQGVTPKGWVNYADNTDMNAPRIGFYLREGYASNYIGGDFLLDDVRLIHNECIYTESFVVPTAELSAGI